MKKFKSIIIMLIVLLLTMSCFVACGPSGDDDENWVVDGGTGPNNNNNITTDPNNPSTPGTNNTTPGTNNTTPGTNNTTPGTNNTTPGTNTPGDEPVDLNQNPLLNPNKKQNKGVAPSVDIDKTGFSKGTIAELKGKALTLYTAYEVPVWTYENENGKVSDEYTWYKDVKKTYGVTVKFMKAGPKTNVIKPFQAMSAGKDCDLVVTDLTSIPYVCNILAPMDQYANFNNYTNNPALDVKTMELTKWKGHPIIAAVGLEYGGIVYNQAALKEYGMSDPYELFKKDQWTWANFKKIMVGLPDKTKEGKTLIGMASMGHSAYWASANGKPPFEIDTTNPNGGIINNWDTADVREAYVWLEGVCDAGGRYTFGYQYGMYETHKTTETLMCKGPIAFADVVANPKLKGKFNWVPFPRNEANPNSFCNIDLGCKGIGLARKTNKESNRAAAMKFCELWATRATETNFDALMFKLLMPYDDIEYYYNHARKYSLISISYGLGDFYNKAIAAFRLHDSVVDASLSTAAAMEKCSNTAKQEIQTCLKFGNQ